VETNKNIPDDSSLDDLLSMWRVHPGSDSESVETQVSIEKTVPTEQTESIKKAERVVETEQPIKSENQVKQNQQKSVDGVPSSSNSNGEPPLLTDMPDNLVSEIKPSEADDLLNNEVDTSTEVNTSSVDPGDKPITQPEVQDVAQAIINIDALLAFLKLDKIKNIIVALKSYIGEKMPWLDRVIGSAVTKKILLTILKSLPKNITRTLAGVVHIAIVFGSMYLTISHEFSSLPKLLNDIIHSDKENKNVEHHLPSYLSEFLADTKSVYTHKREVVGGELKTSAGHLEEGKAGSTTLKVGSLSLANGSTGIDVSHYQGNIKWSELSKETVQFVFIKTTQGTTFIDPHYVDNTKGARQNNLLQGGYHFYDPTKGPIEQADFFLTNLIFKDGDLPPVLDIEVFHGKSKTKLVADLNTWLKKVETATKCKPIIYTYHPFWQENLQSKFPDYIFWIADYDPLKKLLFTEPTWLFWQYTQKGKIDGVGTGAVDLNRFRTLPEITKLCAGNVSGLKDDQGVTNG